MSKKFLSALLAVLMVVSMVPMAAVAATDSTEVTAENAGALTAGSYKITQELTADLVVKSGEVNLQVDGKLTNSSGNTITVEKGATLTITGKGTIDNKTHQKAALQNNGTAILSGCTFSRSQEKGTSGNANGNSWYTIDNAGTMTINAGTTVIPAGTVESPAGSYSSLIRSFGDESAATLTIKGGKFNGGVNTVKNDNNSVLFVEGGELKNTARYVIMNWNEATISGGTFSTSSDATCGAVQNVKNPTNGEKSKGKLVISNGDFSAPSGTPVIQSTTNATYKSTDITITGGTFSSDPFAADSGITSTTYVSELVNGKYVVKPDTTKEELITKIEEAINTNGAAPLNDTRTGADKVEVLVKDGTYKVTAAKNEPAAGAEDPADINVTVEAEELVGHQNAASPKSMGYWVGVKFPVVDGWTISAYKRDGQQSSASIDASDFTTEGDVTTLNGYYNVGDTSEEVTNSRVRPVWVTYKKGEQTVDVKFNVDLTGVEIVVPAKEPEEDGTLSEETKKDLTDAITAAATGSSKNDEETGEASKDVPTVSVGTIANGTVTIDKTIVGALKEAADDGDKNDVDLKIVGQGGAEATIPATTAKALDAAKDLKPTVKAETTSDANVDTENLTADAATKAIVTRALESLDAEGKYVVTVTMEQESKLFTDPASCEIIVKVPVPSSDYDTVIHIGDDGKVTKEPAEKGGDAENGYFLTVTLNHLSQVFGAKSSEVSDIPVDPGELGAAAMPKVTYTKLADMTGAVTGVNGTINQNDVYNESGVLVVKNTSEATQRYIISVGPKATANSFNIAYVVKLEKNEQYVLQCQQTLAVKVVGVGMTTNLNEKFKMEDFDIDDWVNVTEAENSYTGVTAD